MARKNKKHIKISFFIGAVLLSVLVVFAVAGFFYTPYSVEEVNYKLRLSAPSLKHFFGTDNMGRDVFSRVVSGLGATLAVSLGITAIGAGMGVLIGAFTGYFGGIADEIIMRLNDTLASFPSILLALVCVSLFGSGTANVVWVLGVLFIPSYARVVRSEFIREKEKDYVKNAGIYGASHLRIIFLYILPNIKESFFAAIAIGINNAILAEAGLSYLGLGVQPPVPSLGRMLAEGQTFILKAPWVCVFPGAVIMLTVLAFALVSENLESRDYVSVFGAGRKNIRNFYKNTAAFSDVSYESPEKDTLLSVRNLHVAVNDGGELREVVSGLSFDVRSGQSLGIVGESGSGKSMTASAVMKLLGNKAVYAADSVLFDGKELCSIKTKELNELRGSEIAMVFQEPMTSLNPTKKVGKQLADAVKTHVKHKKRNTQVRLNEKNAEETAAADKTSEEVKQIVLSAMKDAGLDDCDRIYNSYPHQLSGGQRQRLLIAMAIALKPKLIICDEPTTALDAEIADKILERLEKLRDEYRLSMIFISHDLSVIGRLCERVIVMKDGIKIEEGSFKEITDSPSHGYTKELVSAGKWHELFGSGKLKSVPAVNENQAAVRKLTENVRASGQKTMICKVENLCVTYDKNTKKELKVFENVDFSVNKGECVGISGKSGSGKTTLLKTLVGMTEYDGKIELSGRALMVFQDPYSSLNPSMKIEKMLDEVQLLQYRQSRKNGKGAEKNSAKNSLPSKSDRRKKSVEMLRKVGLDESYLSRKPAELSGGQRQRTAIALAVITEPELVLLDEPVTALDVTVQEKVLKLLMQLKKDYGLTYLLISHDLNLLEAVCDRIFAL